MKHHKWSERSKAKLDTCHPTLILLCNEVLMLSPLDVKVLDGHRSNERQDELYRMNMTQLKAGQSKHNRYPSEAVDIAPLVRGAIQWDNKELFMQFSGFVRGVAAGLNIDLISGVDWNNNFMSSDHSFFDGPHYELKA